MEIINNYSLKKLNSFAVDAVAAKYVLFSDFDEISKYAKDGFFLDEKYFIIGAGTNTLFKNDYEGIIIGIAMPANIEIDSKMRLCRATSHTIWDTFVNATIENNLYGMENLAGIPGTVGAAAVQNIGAYGIEQEKYFKYLEAIDLHTGKYVKFEKKECHFAYRNSVFKVSNNLYFITNVCYELAESDKYCIDYEDLKIALAGNKPTARSIYDAVIALRNKKIPDYHKFHNAGSFFKNPVINEKHFINLYEKYPTIKYFDDKNGVKISAAWLIEDCGWKGKRIGDVGVSEKHSLIIINYCNATGQEIYNFSNEIIKSVSEKFNITLVPEVVMV